MAVGRVFGAVADLLAYFLRDLLHDNSGDCVTDLLGNLHTDLLGYFLLHIHRILSANCFGEFFALFSGDVDRKILTPFIRHLERKYVMFPSVCLGEQNFIFLF